MLISTVLSYLVIALVRKVYAAPPAACHAPFRWDDCGKDPTPVVYYWKSGSRCEVGMWRGCLPNINMFPDEYECVATCIFAARAGMEDYHSFNELEVDSDETTKDPYNIHEKPVVDDTISKEANDTETDTTDDTTDDASDGNSTTTEETSESGNVTESNTGSNDTTTDVGTSNATTTDDPNASASGNNETTTA